MKAAIRQRAAELGFDACHFTHAGTPDRAAAYERWLTEGRNGEMQWLVRNAEKRVDPQKVLPGARSLVVLATSYHRGSILDAQSDANCGNGSVEQPEPPQPAFGHPLPVGRGEGRGEGLPLGLPTASRRRHQGVVARYARYSDYHDVLAERLKTLTQFVDSLATTPSRSLWYVDTGPLLERELAERAGLGFVGKHTNLIGRSLGNWFFLSEIITTLELEPDAPEHNRCGKCSRCIAACPTGAITAPFALDARRCISYLTIELKGSIPVELRSAIGNRIYGCDDCLAACPWNKFAREGRIMSDHVRGDLDMPDLLELLALDHAAFKQRFAGTPMLRTKRRGVLRNVCVALGNVGDAMALPALERAADDPEPLIAEHAVWAIGEIRRRSGSETAK